MNPLTYALITPSFRLDFERCALLNESVQRFVAADVHHYIVVDRRDIAVFKRLTSNRTSILVVEDVVPSWMFRVPGLRRFWFSLRTRPLKNWILQQIVKISIPAVILQDVLLYADSDVFFSGPYDPRALEREGNVPLYVQTGQRGLIDNNDRWHDVASELLGLSSEGSYDTNYIGNVISWRRDAALAMRSRIEEIAKKDWPLTLAPLNSFSEYVLYGTFAERVLGVNSGHWKDGVERTLSYWGVTPLDIAGLEKFKTSGQPHHHSVMISAKSRTPVELIRKAFF